MKASIHPHRRLLGRGSLVRLFCLSFIPLPLVGLGVCVLDTHDNPHRFQIRPSGKSSPFSPSSSLVSERQSFFG
ncbi:hypothetical protein LZ31DRAFT_273549 [Colletotrichum somersetense]|nr:hypothetical protein LZ31DRAFT_273549 [Colletotrichum somersetense]